jgi:hypothetical protein
MTYSNSSPLQRELLKRSQTMEPQINHYPSFYEIREAHGWKRDYERYLPFSRYIYRPIAFLVTWIGVRIGLTTEMASYFSGILGITGLLFLICKNESLTIAGIISLHLFNLFDCVDGSIARATKIENPYGKFLDSIIGDAINFAFFAFVAITLYRHPDLALYQGIDQQVILNLWLIVGGGAALSCILLQHIESIYDAQIRASWDSFSHECLLNSKDTVSEGTVNDSRDRSEIFAEIIRLIDRNLRVRETHYFALIFAYWLCFVDMFLVFFLIYYSLRVISAAFMFGRRAFILKRIQEQAGNPIEDNSRVPD